MAKSNKFGTFGGVFTPSILTILGVIMYLRLPMIIGEAGLYATIGIIIVAHLISITTGLSVSSIATDKKVQAGGTYYMISRSLGLPIGGTLGLALFVGLSFSVSLYLIGFSESFLSFWGFEATKDNIRITGSIILLAVTIITFISTSLALKTQYFIMAAIILSLISIFLGKHEHVAAQPFLTNPNSKIPLMVLFGIFFPAVTGFEAGVSMSGDLKDPKKSIPMGSISAIAVGLIVYIGLTFYFSRTVDPEIMANDPKVLLKISRIPELVIAGIWGATLSSALGSILGAPRILQATATDRITHRFFARGTGKSKEPRNALLLTFIIAEAGILIGELNVIARIVSIFFITTYGFLNLSCAFERLTSADFRPAFKTPAWISILGAIACIVVMIQLDILAMLGATVILSLVYLLIKRKELVLQSGDAWSSLWASLVKSGLKKLGANKLANRNWRPNIIMFSGNLEERSLLVGLGKDISGKLGILTAFNLEIKESGNLTRLKNIENHKTDDNSFFLNQHQCRDVFTGIDEIIRLYGFNGIQPNTILMGWSHDPDNKSRFMETIGKFKSNNLNTIFYSNQNSKEASNDKKSIDIWWSGKGPNLSFTLNLIRHLIFSPNWENLRIRLYVVTYDSSLVEIIYNSIENILSGYRLEMEIRVINNSIDQKPVNELIQRETHNTELAIIATDIHQEKDMTLNYRNLDELANRLNTVLFVQSSDQFESFNIINNEKALMPEEKISNDYIELHKLKLTPYPILNDNLKQCDSNGMHLLESFIDKSVNPFFREQHMLITDLIDKTNPVFGEIEKLLLIKEKYRKTKLFNKTRNSLFERINHVLETFTDEKINVQTNLLQSGISWYEEKTNNLLLEIPGKVSVSYPKETITIHSDDTRALKWFKLKKKWKHPFAKTSFKHKVKLRKVARVYLGFFKQASLHHLLKEMNIAGLKNHLAVKEFLIFLNEQLIRISKEDKINELTSDEITQIHTKINDHINAINDKIKANNQLARNKLIATFRKDLNKMSGTLSALNANNLISKKYKQKKYFNQLKAANLSFSNEWNENIVHVSNKLLLDHKVMELRGKIANECHELYIDINALINVELLNKLKAFMLKLEGLKQQKELKNIEIPELEINQAFFSAEGYFEDFNKKIFDALEGLPEEYTVFNPHISSAEDIEKHEKNTMTIPLRKMARHYVNSLLIGELNDELEKLSVNIKKTAYQVKDHVSYLKFEMANLEQSEANHNEKALIIIDEAIEAINKDQENIYKLSEGLFHITSNEINNAFAPLAPELIIESTKKLPHILREYQSRKTMSRFERWYDVSKSYVKKNTVKLMYSKSEGILLAKKLTDQNQQQYLNEQLLNIVEKVSPEPRVLDMVPTYYKNLFSGRSSISDDFWIERRIEEQQFNKAVKNYNQGYKGGILITGDRNSGKTTFCNHMCRRYFKADQVIHLFPPLKGSCKPAAFEEELKIKTGINGNAHQILNRLPFGKVLVIHDLELWWESNENGLEVIKTIIELVRTFSHKCLFIANINQWAYQRISNILNLSNQFISKIQIKPFDAEELKELVIRRHRSGGFKYTYKKRHENTISEIRLAGLFNKYFDYTNGNPGTALYAWIANIQSCIGDQLNIKVPDRPNFAILENLPDDWSVILYQLFLHKRMGIEKLQNVLKINRSAINEKVQALLMTGLIKEKSPGLYIVNPYINNFLAEHILKDD